MRPVARILLNALTALPLVVYVAALLLIGWSFRAAVRVNLGSGARQTRLSLVAGRIGVDNQSVAAASAAAARQNQRITKAIKNEAESIERRIRDARDWRSLAEFDRVRQRQDVLIRGWKARTLAAPPIPPWNITVGRPVVAAVVTLASIPLVMVVLRRRKISARSVDNICGVCGYDLRATPDRCSECGTIAKT